MRQQPPSPATTLVDDPSVVAAALQQVDEDVVGVDVERADAARYFRRAALVQIGVADRCVLLDGVALADLDALDRFLAGRTTVLHAAENDLEPLAAKSVHPTRIADTAVAAALLGHPTGLRALLHEVLSLELDGDKGQFQRADWEARPLPDDMVAYAVGDVVHLPELWRALEQELAAGGRLGWYQQELEWTVARAADDSRDWTRVKGAGSLDPEQRAVLRAVWEERERLAREHDLAPNRLLHDDVLRALAVDPPRTAGQLVRRSQRRRNLLRRHADALQAAVVRGLRTPPERRPDTLPPGQRSTESDRAVYDALRKARAEVAREVGIDAGVLCPSRPLWGAATGTPGDGRELCQLAGLRPWQTELLEGALWAAYTRHAAPADVGVSPDPEA